MIKKILFTVFVLFLGLNSLVGPASAGIFGGGEITIYPFAEITACSVGVYSTIPDRVITANIFYTGLIDKFVKRTYPTNMQLTTIDCPMESVQRRTCIEALCADPNATSCKNVCTDFVGPFVFSPEDEMRIDGSVVNRISVERMSISEPVTFSVVFYPFKYNTSGYIANTTHIDLTGKEKETVCFKILSGYPEPSMHKLSQKRLDDVVESIEPMEFELEEVTCDGTWCEGDDYNIQEVCVNFKKGASANGKLVDDITIGETKDILEIPFQVSYIAEPVPIYAYVGIGIASISIILYVITKLRKPKLEKENTSPSTGIVSNIE